MANVILDHYLGIRYNQAEHALKNFHALYYLPRGLHRLAMDVRQLEIGMVESLGVPAYTFHWAPGDENIAFVACCYSWFSVSLCNYLRLIALVNLVDQAGWKRKDVKDSKNQALIKQHCAAYVKDAIPDIYLWRNKIAAHSAITDPKIIDNLATLEYSAMNPVSYHMPYYMIGSIQWQTGGEQSNLPAWSLTESFEKLRDRFWPSLEIAKLPESINGLIRRDLAALA